MGVALDIPKHRISSAMPHVVLESYPDNSLQMVFLDTRLVHVAKWTRFSINYYWRTLRLNVAHIYEFLSLIDGRVQCYAQRKFVDLMVRALNLREESDRYYESLPEGLLRYLFYVEYLLYLCQQKLRPQGSLLVAGADSIIHIVRALADSILGPERYMQTINVAYIYNKISRYRVQSRERRLRNDWLPCLWYTKSDDYTFQMAEAIAAMKKHYASYTYNIPFDSTNIIPVRLDRQYRWSSSFLLRVPEELFLLLFYLFTEPLSMCMHLQSQVPTAIKVATATQRIVHVNVVPYDHYKTACIDYVQQQGIDYENIQYSQELEIEAEDSYPF